jgi:hypothetical protein
LKGLEGAIGIAFYPTRPQPTFRNETKIIASIAAFFGSDKVKRALENRRFARHCRGPNRSGDRGHHAE